MGAFNMLNLKTNWMASIQDAFLSNLTLTDQTLSLHGPINAIHMSGIHISKIYKYTCCIDTIELADQILRTAASRMKQKCNITY